MGLPTPTLLSLSSYHSTGKNALDKIRSQIRTFYGTKNIILIEINNIQKDGWCLERFAVVVKLIWIASAKFMSLDNQSFNWLI